MVMTILEIIVMSVIVATLIDIILPKKKEKKMMKLVYRWYCKECGKEVVDEHELTEEQFYNNRIPIEHKHPALFTNDDISTLTIEIIPM
jgi:hypothetical protein